MREGDQYEEPQNGEGVRRLNHAWWRMIPKVKSQNNHWLAPQFPITSHISTFVTKNRGIYLYLLFNTDAESVNEIIVQKF